MAELEGRTAVVTGGSSGIGLETARLLGRAGARVLVAARGAGRLRAVSEEMGAEAVACDVATEAGVAELDDAARAAFGGAAPDIVVNAAGAFFIGSIAETPVDAFDGQVAANLRAPFLVIRAFLGRMIERGTGHVVTVGSVAGRMAFPGNGAYSASKFGVRGLHEVLAQELRGTGVRATLLEPAATDTPLWDAIEAAPGLPAREQMLAPIEVAQAVLFVLTRPAGVAVPTLPVERW